MLKGLILAVAIAGSSVSPHKPADQPKNCPAQKSDEQGNQSSVEIARYTFWLTVFTGLLVLVSGAEGFLIYRQFGLGRRALIADQRAWIVPNIMFGSGLEWSATEGRLKLIFALENTGKTPARRVEVFPEIHFRHNAPPTAAQRVISNKIRTRPDTFGYTIFPDKPFVQEYSIAVTISDMEKWWDEREALTGNRPDLIVPYLVGCIDYLDVMGGKHHQTGFVFRIERLPRDGGVIAIGPNHGNILAQDLRLVSEEGFLAD